MIQEFEKQIKDISDNKEYLQYKIYYLESLFEKYNEILKRQMSLFKQNTYMINKVFTKEDLANYNGQNGMKAYVAIKGIVFDVTNEKTWIDGTHFGLTAGSDVTNQFMNCHQNMLVLNKLPKVGIYKNE